MAMTRTDAALLLDVKEDAPLGEIRKRYETLHNEYQIRLTNAPTAALKRTYQQKLHQVGAAIAVFDPTAANAGVEADLPIVDPVLDPDLLAGAPKAAPNSPGRAVPARPAPGPTAGLPRSTMIVATIAVVLAGALTLTVMQWRKAAGRADVLQSEGLKLLQAAEQLQGSASRNEALFYADRLRVQNLSKGAITIIAAAFVYRDGSGAIRTIHTSELSYPKWEIRPGGVVQLDAELARGRRWDGSVAYYALVVEYPGIEPFLMSGIWSRDVDRDKAVTIDLD